MKKSIIITDFSKMPGGICIYGYDDEYNPIRPVVFQENEKPRGLPIDFISNLKPLSRVEFDFIRPVNSIAPHTEDWYVNENYKPVLISYLSDTEKINLLEGNCYKKMCSDCWGTEVKFHIDGRGKNISYITPGNGFRSIATIAPDKINFVECSPNEYRGGALNYKIRFAGILGDDIKITDLDFINYCDSLKNKNWSCESIGLKIKKSFDAAEKVFIRVGAGRAFAPGGCNESKCFLFATAIYTFPDFKK